MKSQFVNHLIILFVFFSTFVANAQTKLDSIDMYGTIGMVDKNQYELLLSLPALNFENGAFRQIHWIYEEYKHTKKKEAKKSQYFLTSPSISNDKSKYKIFTQSPTILSQNIFGRETEKLQQMAIEAEDPVFKSMYRQMTISSIEADIAKLETQQSMERSIAGAEFASSVIVAASAAAKIIMDKNKIDYINESIRWAFGQEHTYFNSSSEAPELFIVLILEYQPIKGGANIGKYKIVPKVKSKNELIELPTRVLEVQQFKRKDFKKGDLSKMKGMTTFYESEFPADHTKIDMGYYSGLYSIFAMLIRQMTYDYLVTTELLKNNQYEN